MKKDKINVDYKKLTIEIPFVTFLEMEFYCIDEFTGRKNLFYCDFIKKAIEFYIDNH